MLEEHIKYQYQPVKIQVEKNLLLNVIDYLDIGLENTQELLGIWDDEYRRETRSSRLFSEQLEVDMTS